ncbi:uncharacterized protein [Mytilus edulis]|uniref:uncharacterized protein n=1 Tax=Mytilus edulis TaxID=6550 RepID=UPI0039EEC8A7
MASIQQHCDICDHRHITKPSTVWCPECKQAFCKDCNDYHGFSKSSENHVTVSIRDYLSMSSSISETSNICMEHTEQYQMVCQAHDKLICPSCIENHEGCKGIVSLRKMIENVKKSSFFQETRLSLKDIDQNIKTLQIELNEQQGRIKQQEEKILSQVTDTRKKIDDHFDKLEKKIKNEIFEITSESKDSIKNKLQILENKTDSTNKAEQQLQDMDRYATELQTYFGLQKISLEAATTESYLQSITGDHILDAPTILFNIDDKIDNLSSSIQSFGSLEVQKTHCKLSLVTHKTKQAQLVESKIRSITDIKPSLVKTVKPDVQDIRGIVVLPNGNIALSDYSTKNVLVFSTDWQILSQISVKPANAFDITYIDYKTVATTSNNEQSTGVSIIDIDTEKVTLIPTKYQCYGIKHHNGSLFICAKGDGVCKLNPQDGRSTAIWKYDLPPFSYIEVFNDKIYFTYDGPKSIVCCDMNGGAIWTFKDENILKYPRGIALDNYGNVYVACSALHRIVVLSPDGQQNRQLLSSVDGLFKPYGIHFDRKNNRVLIRNQSKKHVCVFEVIN